VETKVQPQHLVVGEHAGARFGGDGHVLPHTILGNAADYEQRAPEPIQEETDLGSFQPVHESDDEDNYSGSFGSKAPSVASGRSGRSGRSMRSSKSFRSGAGAGARRGSIGARSQKSGAGRSEVGSQRGASVAQEAEEKSFYERSADERQMRALERWNYFEEERAQLYDRFKEGRKKMKNGPEPVMFSGDEFRERFEEYDLIDKAMPREEKFRDSLWFMSLRDSWCRYIPLGSIFSGLFCKVKEKDISEKAFTIIRNPTQSSLINTKLQKGRTRDGGDYEYHTKRPQESIPKLSWVNDENMWAAEKYHRRAIKELLPFRVDSEGLMVYGRDIWTYGEDVEGEEALEGENGEGVAKEGSTHSHVTGSKRDVGQPSVAGPQVTFLQNHLAFDTSPGKVNSQRLAVQNSGTTAIYYKWHKAEQLNKLGVPLRGINPPGGGFYTIEEEGILLPGNTTEFSFAFKSALCGIYTASFHMTTVPPLPEDAPPLTVTMRGVVTAPDENEVKRSLLEEHLEHNSVIHGIQEIIMEAIRRVELPPPAAGAEDQPEDETKIDAKKFAKANTAVLIKGDVPCVTTQTVYYHKDVLDEMRGLAKTATELPQLGDQPVVVEESATEALMKSLTPREAVYDPSVEKKVDESWEEDWSWSNNVLDLGVRQLGVVSEHQRTEELGKLDVLIERAIWHEHRPNQLYPLALDAMSELAENIETTAAQTRRRLGLPKMDFRDPEADPPPDAGKAAKGAPVDDTPEVDPELEKDFKDALYIKVRQLLCDAVDHFSDLASVVVIDEADRRGEDMEED